MGVATRTNLPPSRSSVTALRSQGIGELELVADSQAPALEGTGLRLEHGAGAPAGQADTPGSHADDVDHAQLAIQEGDIDGETHPQTVDGSGPGQDKGAFISRPSQEAPQSF